MADPPKCDQCGQLMRRVGAMTEENGWWYAKDGYVWRRYECDNHAELRKGPRVMVRVELK